MQAVICYSVLMLKDYLINQEPTMEKLRRLGFVFLCLLVFDLSCTGSGRIISLGWISPRILLALLCMICAMPHILKQCRTLLKKPINIAFLVFVVYLLFQAVRGKIAGHPSWIWNSDVMGFAWLMLIPLFQVLVRNKKEIKTLLGFIIAGASLQAAVIVGFNLYFTLFDRAGVPAFWEQMVETGWGTILAVEYNAIRVFCRSSMYMTVVSLVLMGRLLSAPRFSWKWAALLLLNLFGLFFTYTRSLYLAFFAALFLLIVFLVTQYPIKRIIIRFLLVLLMFLSLGILSDILLHQGSFQYAVARCLHMDLQAKLHLPKTWDDTEVVNMEEITEKTNDTRDNTLADLRERIKESPIIGHGLGASGSYRNTNDEYFYHDLIMRCGVIGLLLYFTPVAMVAIVFWQKKSRLGEGEESLIYGIALIAFLIATYFNPWMNAAIGISWYALCVRSTELFKEADNG